MKVPYINLIEDHRILKKQIFRALEKVFKDCNFIVGEEMVKFEERIAKFCGMKFAVGVNSGTDALFLALKVLNIGKGDEVITVPNSFIATASAIVATGAKPVFVDVREDMNINPNLIEKHITKKTKAILPVHLTGKPAEMKPILRIAQDHELFVIEDAAQALGAEYKGKKVGSFGTIGCFSFHPAKTLNACGDGGMITTNNKSIYETLLQLRNIGLKNRNDAVSWGINSRLDTFQAAILNLKFNYLLEWIEKRRKNADFYRKHLSAIVECPKEEKFEKHTYHLFVIQTERRDELQNYLLRYGIDTRVHYPTPIHLQPCAKSLGYKRGDFPVAEKQAEQILSLPIYQTLTRQQLEYVVEKITDFFRR